MGNTFRANLIKLDFILKMWGIHTLAQFILLVGASERQLRQVKFLLLEPCTCVTHLFARVTPLKMGPEVFKMNSTCWAAPGPRPGMEAYTENTCLPCARPVNVLQKSKNGFSATVQIIKWFGTYAVPHHSQRNPLAGYHQTALSGCTRYQP